MSISIEKAKVDDLDALYEIEKECFTIEAFSKRQIASLLRRSNSISLLAKINDEVVGFLIALIHKINNEKIAHIITLDVAVKARRKRVGLRMFENLDRILEKNEVKVCYLEVRVDNKAARKFYRKLGYVETEMIRNFYCSGKDGIRMRKILQ